MTTNKSDNDKPVYNISVKSKYHAEFRRYSIKSNLNFNEFKEVIKRQHNLTDIQFLIFYTDPKDFHLLPINNDENYDVAKSKHKSLFKIILQNKGESYNDLNDFNKKKNFFDNLNNLLTTNKQTPKLKIDLMEDFHQVSSIIDTDKVPKTCRRVKITKHGTDKPLGFYIRDGYSLKITSSGLQNSKSIFISRVLPGGLAESTGLLAVDDEVLEVNGIDLSGKSIEQATDMMVANASNLILTIKPSSQNFNNSFMSTRSTNTNSLQRTPQRNLQFEFPTNQQKTSQQLQMQNNNHNNNNNSYHQYQQIHQQQHQQQQPNNFLQNSLRNKSNNNNQPNLIHYQQNSSFNYPKSYQTSSTFNTPKQSNNLVNKSNTQHHNYLQENQQQNINQNLIQFNNSSMRSNLEFFNNTFFMKNHQEQINNQSSNLKSNLVSNMSSNLNSNLQNQQPQQQNIYQNINQFNLIKNNNLSNKNTFGIEDDINYEDEDDDDEQDEIMDYNNQFKV